MCLQESSGLKIAKSTLKSRAEIRYTLIDKTSLFLYLVCLELTVVMQENKENQERRQKEMQERQAEMDRLNREAEERAEMKKKNEMAERKRIEREQRIESLKKTAVGIRALETITPGVCS